MKRERIMLSVVILTICTVGFAQASSMGTAFTYQGRLADANSPADGPYDFQFAVFNDPDAGSQQGSTVTKDEVEVTDGYFTAELDFGSSVFTGNARWLQIGVRQGLLEDPNTYSVLSPRHELTPTPHAIYAVAAGSLNAADGDPTSVVYVDETGNVGVGTTTPGAKLEVVGDQIIGGDLDFGGSLATVGFANDGVINLNGDLTVVSALSGSISAGTSMELDAGTNLDLQAGATMNISAPLVNISGNVMVSGPIYGASGDVVLSGEDSVYVTMDFNDDDPDTRAIIFGKNHISSPTELMRIQENGNVGIGTPSPGAKLHVVGDAEITGGLEVANDISGGFGTSITPRIAFGNNADASGGYGAMAVGFNATATGTVAIALGQAVTASGYDATAMGRNTTASGQYSTAMGHSITAQGNYSFGIGLDDTSSTVTADNTMAIMGGNVGIGTTSPSTTLQVQSRTDNFASVRIGSDNDNDAALIFFTNAGDWNIGVDQSDSGKLKFGLNSWIPGNSAKVTIDTAGRVGIGNSSPGSPLSVSSLPALSANYRYIVQNTSDNSDFYYRSSSIKSKEKVMPYKDDFGMILQAEPRLWVDKATRQTGYGYIAEELLDQGLANLVTFSDGKPADVKYELISLYLLEVIKDLVKTTTQLTEDNQQLNEKLVTENESLKQRLAAVEKILSQPQFARILEVQNETN